jgi:hypothetical protein
MSPGLSRAGPGGTASPPACVWPFLPGPPIGNGGQAGTLARLARNNLLLPAFDLTGARWIAQVGQSLTQLVGQVDNGS